MEIALSGLLLYGTALVTVSAIYAVSCLGLNLNWGMSGLFNVGIAGFFAAGAYTSAILTALPSARHLGGFDLPLPVGLVAAMAVSAAIAWAVGRICLRLRSDYLAIATIGIAEILRLVFKNERDLTGGAVGIQDIPRPFSAYPQPWSDLAFMALVLAILAAIYLFMERVRVSPWGRVTRAIRDNEAAAAAAGKNVEAFRLQAFVIGSAFMGLSGALSAHYLKFLSPEATEPLVATFLVWVMLIVGGSGNNRGAIVGALAVWVLWTATELFSGQLPSSWALRAGYLRVFLIGLLLVVVLQRFSRGILPEQPPKLADAPATDSAARP